MAKILSVNELLKESLCIPDYQRPYKWDAGNISTLLDDIKIAIDSEKSRYRLGTVILHKEGDDKPLNIVDGQQRIISLVLINLYLNPDFTCEFLKNTEFGSKVSHAHVSQNYAAIALWFSDENEEYREKFLAAMDNLLEIVVLTVDLVEEAFQLFDSQNNRGKTLDPNDILKAHHLREMNECSSAEIENVVMSWESRDAGDIYELFNRYLYPILCWSRKVKGHGFTVDDIEHYKGFPASSPYGFAKRLRGVSEFQLTEPYVAGRNFFDMAAHYFEVKGIVEREILKHPEFDFGDGLSAYLFKCAVMLYYDRFAEFDYKVMKKLFVWVAILRIKRDSMYDKSIRRYAIGDYEDGCPVFSIIANAKTPKEVRAGVTFMNPSRYAVQGRYKLDVRNALLKRVQNMVGV